MIGTMFGGFLILSKLGAGGMGEVYRARGGDGHEVALKLISHLALTAEAAPELRQRFRRELRIALALDHPHIVRTLSGGEIDGAPFMVCALMAGGSLHDLLKTTSPLPGPQTLSLLRDILLGLGAIEGAGLIHRDIKPGNVLLNKDGRALLSDLGLARSTDHERTMLTAQGLLVGSPLYMAPEQIMGAPNLDIRCDLYAVGALAFHCLTGAPPYLGKTAAQICKGHLQAPIPDLQGRAPELGDALPRLVSSLLQKEPRARPPGPAQVLEQYGALFASAQAIPTDWLSPGAPPTSKVEEREVASLDTTALMGTPTISGGATGLEPRREATLTSRPTFQALAVENPGSGHGTLSASGTLDGAPKPPPMVTLPGGAFEMLRPDDAAPGLSRARLVIGAGARARTLFVYGGTRLQLGRNAMDYQAQDVCLRLRPRSAWENESQKISGKHFEVRAGAEGAFIRDLGSRQGTRLGERRLPPDADAPLPGIATVEVAQVLTLNIHTIPEPASATPSVLAIGSARPGAPALSISRPENGPEHSYALVPGRLLLNLGPQGDLVPQPASPQGVELFWLLEGPDARGSLWLRGGALRPGTCRPLRAGMSFEVGGKPVSVHEIRPEDQKD